MPENGSGRLDRIETILEQVSVRLDRLAALGASHAREANERMTRVEMSLENIARSVDRRFEFREQDRREMLEREKRTDERIEKLVSSIGELIQRIPPENLRRT